MKTHPESVWLDGTRIALAKSLNADFFSVVVSGRKVIDSDLEFVPASAYIKLQNELVTANAQLQAQAENMLALEKERDELRAAVDKLTDKTLAIEEFHDRDMDVPYVLGEAYLMYIFALTEATNQLMG